MRDKIFTFLYFLLRVYLKHTRNSVFPQGNEFHHQTNTRFLRLLFLKFKFHELHHFFETEVLDGLNIFYSVVVGNFLFLPKNWKFHENVLQLTQVSIHLNVWSWPFVKRHSHTFEILIYVSFNVKNFTIDVTFHGLIEILSPELGAFSLFGGLNIWWHKLQTCLFLQHFFRFDFAQISAILFMFFKL